MIWVGGKLRADSVVVVVDSPAADVGLVVVAAAALARSLGPGDPAQSSAT